MSVATSGTHDTETMAEWWDGAAEEERLALADIPSLRPLQPSLTAPFTDGLRDGLLATLFGSGSQLLILPIQDIFGWRDRVNVPALISDDQLVVASSRPGRGPSHRFGGQERASFLADLSRTHGRS